MHTVRILTHLVENQQHIAYMIMLVGVLFEGEMTVLSTGVLINLGALDVWSSLAVILCGGLCKTIFGYHLGSFVRRKWSNVKFFKFFEKRVRQIAPQFREKPFWSIFASKFIIGANVIIILFSGFERVDFKKYLKAEIAASLIWAPGLVALGYFFSHTALHVSHEVSKFTLVVFALVAAYFVLDKIIGYIYELLVGFYQTE
jgi:membrane protein DedA with SNARE-associated domain